MPAPKTQWNGVSAHNKTTISSYLSEGKIQGLSESTLINRRYFLVQLSRFLQNKHFKDATSDDMKEFFKSFGDITDLTLRTTKLVMKNFYRWLYGLEKDERYPDVVRWIKFKSKSKILQERKFNELKLKIVSKEEYQKMIDFCRGNIQHQAILETLYLSGCRVSELTSMNISDVEQDENGFVTITVRQSKTKPRQIPITPYPEFLMRWYDETPFGNQENKPLWINFNNDYRVYMKRLSKHYIDELFRTIIKEQKLKKITPHCFRHTCISKDRCEGMPDTHICSKYGWVKGSDMLEIYDHNDYDELKKWITKGKKTQPTYDIIKRQKERLENEFEQRFKSMEQNFEEKMKILDSRMAKSARRYDVPSEKILHDYQRLKQGLEMMLNRMTVEGRSQAEIEEFRKMITAGLS